MKKMKRLMSVIVLCAILVSTLISNGVNAAEPILNCSDDLQGYTATCPYSSNGKHLMSAKSTANVYRGAYPNGTYVFTGYEYQCIYCYLCLVTQNAAHLYSRPVWGKYALAGANETIPSGVPMYTNSIGTKNSHDAFTNGFSFGTPYCLEE